MRVEPFSSTPVDAYRVAERMRRVAADELARAKANLKLAEKREHEARYRAIVSIDCPYAPCGALAGQTCNLDYGPAHPAPATQHGMRQDASGVNDVFSILNEEQRLEVLLSVTTDA